MRNVSARQRLKSEIRQVMRSMDFVSGHPALAKSGRGREAERYAAIYQQLALAWEHLALQCRHTTGVVASSGCVSSGLGRNAERRRLRTVARHAMRGADGPPRLHPVRPRYDFAE
jgi:hypothetical protein